MLFIVISFLIIAIFTYLLTTLMHVGALYHALNSPYNKNIIQQHIVSNLPNKNLQSQSNYSNTSVANTYKDNITQAFINACENVRWLSIQNNCTNPNDFNTAWSFLPSLSGNINSISGSNVAFSCGSISAFGEGILYKSISNIISNTCVSCFYNLQNPSSVPYSQLLPYKNNSPYGTNTSHTNISMGDPCAMGSFISCTFICK